MCLASPPQVLCELWAEPAPLPSYLTDSTMNDTPLNMNAITPIPTKHNTQPNNNSMYEPPWAEPVPVPSDLCTSPLNVTPHIKFYQPSYDDVTPPNPPDPPFSLSMSPIEIDPIHTLTLTPIPIQQSYQHYHFNITINLNDTLTLTPTPPKPPT